MRVAATPQYLGDDFSSTSPALRFGMYLKLWEVDSQAGQGLRITKEGKGEALKEAAKIHPSDKVMTAIGQRQQAFAECVPADGRFSCVGEAIAPLTTGLGNEHPLENGFAFLNPYGLPYLPGSGVKGVLRRAAKELADGDWGDTKGWSTNPTYPYPIRTDNNEEPPKLSMIDVLFGREPELGDRRLFRGVLSFWDVLPQIKGDQLMVDIMTPHQGHYYQGAENGGGESPHDSGQPNPISFLTVPPRSRFKFHVVCDQGRLQRFAPDLMADDRWQGLLKAAFEHAFGWLGFGAKTAVGYGQLQRNREAGKERERELKERAERERERKQKESQQKARAEELSHLPEDAQWAARMVDSDRWQATNPSHINNFLYDVEEFLAEREALSVDASRKLGEQLDRRWPGIMDNPDATQGKKNKPKFSLRTQKIAKKLLRLKRDVAE